MNIKVGMIEPVGGHGGMNFYDFSLCESLFNANVDVRLYTCDETDITNVEKFIVENVFRNIYGKDNKIKRALRYIRGLIKALLLEKKRKTKIVHFHFFHISMIEYISVKLAKLMGFQVFVTAHDVVSFVNNEVTSLANKVYNSVDSIICHNNISKSELIKNYNLNGSKLHVIPHGNYISSIQECEQSSARKQIGLDDNLTYILFFGQIKKVKGLDILLKALPEVFKRNNELRLIIAGKVWKDDFSVYQKIIDEFNLSNKIIKRIKYIPDDEIDSYFISSDLVVLPYKRIYQSGVLLHALSYKKAVLASDLPGMKEVITNNKDGYLFTTGDSYDLQKKLMEILESPEHMDIIGSNGFKLVSEKYNWRNIGIKTAELYTKI